MCGLAGYLGTRAPADGRTALAMAARIAHRGPDGADAWADADAGVALGHRRLAVIDPSPAGAQPMASADGRLVLAFNGEIYNHRALRAELEAAGHAPAWRGHSDTETLVEALARWGLDAALPRLDGMFAFAAWDRADRALWLARDRVGEKPLHYAAARGGGVLFGSELKALRAHPGWDDEVDRDALAAFLRLAYVPDPWTAHARARKLPPGHRLVLRAGDDPLAATPAPWWRLADAIPARRRAEPPEALVAEAERRLTGAVASRLEADVPLGAFLSGGVDSALVTALAQRGAARPVRTFTVGFDVAGYDEAPAARAVAAHLGTDHTELRVGAGDALAVVPELPAIWDEPFADSSQVPTLLLSRLTRDHVTVALSGDGGDELFGGYNRHAAGWRLWSRLRRLPGPARRAAATALARAPHRAIDRALARLRPGTPATGDRLSKLARVLGAGDAAAFHAALVSTGADPAALMAGGLGGLGAPGGAPSAAGTPPAGVADPREAMMAADLGAYLPGDVLTKVDRASMAASLEVRAPLLAADAIDLAWSLPVDAKVRGGTGKWILREVLARHVPRALFERPKAGFALPVEAWLDGPLRDWADALLSREAVARAGLLDPEAAARVWADHRDGRARAPHLVWTLAMLQGWAEARPLSAP